MKIVQVWRRSLGIVWEFALQERRQGDVQSPRGSRHHRGRDRRAAEPRPLEVPIEVVRRTRRHPSIEIGGSPRAGLAMIQAARARAFIHGRDYVVPLVVEEPSIVAGLSMAAALARRADGFAASAEESLLIGQIHLVDADDTAKQSIQDAAEDLLSFVNEISPILRFLLPVPPR